ncbi:hypothetical protein OESDEN_05708 [Oesophagostomum dentatum]|uniref:DUF7087 domain-containing protein n=1 Tax=Oesophagostomum dentatum TaxID=61180 RepID=A0A0B1TEW3_OESDE|nr:hypothetical protein OESDEN_05708 [Oesophagostomum dentatum]
MAAPAGRLSFDSYDLPYIVGMTRGVQIVCCIVQLLMIYSESASLSLFWFLLYSVVCAYNLFHLSKRWYYNIDGRYDLKQFVSQSEPTVRVQYGAAIFTPTLIGLIVFFTIELQNGFVHSIFKLATIVQLLMALGQLALEVYEVYVKGN